MSDYFTRFSKAPVSYKKSFAMLAAAWICHAVFIYSFFYFSQAVDQAENVITRMTVISGCLAFLLFLIKKWARALVVVGNCFIVVYDLFVIAVVPTNKMLTLLGVAVILLTITGSYWLFVKDSRDYYTLLNPKQDSKGPLDPKTGPHSQG